MGISSHGVVTVLQVVWGDLFFIWQLVARGGGCPAQRRGLWGGILPGHLLRTGGAQVSPSDSARPSRSAPLLRGQSAGRGVLRQLVSLPPSPTRPARPSLSGRPASLWAAWAPERSPSLSVTAVCAFFLSFFFFFLVFFSFPLLPLSRLVTGLWPIAALPASAGWILIGLLGARSRLPLLRWSKADKRRRLRAPATQLSQSPPTLSSLSTPSFSLAAPPRPGSRAPGTDSWRAASARTVPFWLRLGGERIDE